MQRKKIVPSEIVKQDLEAFVLMHICFHRKVDQTHTNNEERERETDREREKKGEH
jgi:hypothetical protein